MIGLMISLTLTIVTLGYLRNRHAVERTTMVKATVNKKRHFRKA
jgi:hypothetical protein